MRLTNKAQIGIAVVKYCGEHPNVVFNTKTLAEEIGASPEFVGGILSKLKNSSILESTKGPGGGYRLMVPYSNIQIIDILTALDEKLENRYLPSKYFSESMARTIDNIISEALTLEVKRLV